ncbi:exported protein of unknown function [Nitrosotalea devaniterrae]|uniref:Uncharacterized protein n=1 Tax=Nitrosotalea devaniterrae TaxID=1078905 RepID=A0A128A2T2_9ARCH|nr:exported protein of unknown function [Candidatus Nitrosotalea devanaterra]
MKFKAIFLVFVISIFCIALHTGPAFSQQADTCQPNTICAHPGNMLKYNISLRDMNSSQTYSFGNMVDANNINLVQSQDDKSGVQNTTMILNLKTGFAHSPQDVNAVRPFLEVLASPINYSKSDPSVTQLVTDFNGFKRTALVAFHSSENSTSKIVYDIETGILLEEHSSEIITIGGNPEIVDFTDKLASTNMISSDSDAMKNMKSNVSIPKWVKTTAKMWSQGDVQDSEFTNAIQYLISNGIMQIPHQTSGSSSSQTIPTWLKHSTSMWADGQTTDNEFVQSIQWLITKGIVQVGN